jgi:hypothetical protein
MRVLIFGTDAAAQAAVQSQRAAGHHASLRSPQFFSPAEYEPCELAMADAPEIVAVYAARGIPTMPIAAKPALPVAVVDETVQEVGSPTEWAEKPKARRK